MHLLSLQVPESCTSLRASVVLLQVPLQPHKEVDLPSQMLLLRCVLIGPMQAFSAKEMR